MRTGIKVEVTQIEGGKYPPLAHYLTFSGRREATERVACSMCGRLTPDARGGTCRSPCVWCRFPYPHGDCND